MSHRSAVLGAALTLSALTAAAALTAPAASAQSFTHEHFTDVVDPTPYDCEGTPASDSGTVKVVASANVRGSSPFPYFHEHFNGTVVTTNLDTGGTFTNRFVISNHDHTITDNGDGTITITSYASGSSKYYDQDGKFVLKDPGQVRVAFDVDYHGTPGNPDDDTDVPNSFRIIRASTGNSDFSGRNFCDDLVTFTTP